MEIHLIVAMATNRVIGAKGGMPWHLSEDLKRFKRLTMGHPIIMGRKTWDSIGRVLPGRENIVITRRDDFAPEGVVVTRSLDAALKRAKTSGARKAFVIGGGEIFRDALPKADVIELTIIHREYEGDVHFPEYETTGWREVAREQREQDGLHYDFVTLGRAR